MEIVTYVTMSHVHTRNKLSNELDKSIMSIFVVETPLQTDKAKTVKVHYLHI